MIQKSKGALAKFTDYVSAKMGRVANSNVPQKLRLDYSTSEAAFSLRIDPHIGQGPMHIDSSLFTSATSMTSEGAARNKGQFWKLWSQKYPETLSTKNLEVISSGKAPFVDQKWVSHFPEHQKYLGDVLIHHHIDHGHLTVALPKELHGTKPGFSIFHNQ